MHHVVSSVLLLGAAIKANFLIGFYSIVFNMRIVAQKHPEG